MKILNICYDDYANFMHGQTCALRSVGVDVTEAKLKPHCFGYAEEAPVIKPTEIASLIRQADIVQIFHSSKHIANLISATGIKRKFTVWHTGSDYRSTPDAVRACFRKIGVVKEFTDQCEFLMIDPTLEYVAAAINPEIRLLRSWETKGRYVIAHYPSKAEIKGTELINRLMQPYVDRVYFLHSTEKVLHHIQLDRMSQCDVYLELFQPELDGKAYGCHGVTAFEAAALGKVVITQNIHRDAYEKAYGYCPFLIANTEYGFNAAMNQILSYSPEQLQAHQQKTLEWVINNHSFEATGTRVKNILSGL